MDNSNNLSESVIFPKGEKSTNDYFIGAAWLKKLDDWRGNSSFSFLRINKVSLGNKQGYMGIEFGCRKINSKECGIIHTFISLLLTRS